MATVEQVQQRVIKILQKQGSVTLNEDGSIHYEWGSTFVVVSVMDFADGDVIVSVAAPVAFDIPITNELCAELMLNRGAVFGSWSFMRDNESDKKGLLVFQNRILGNDIDESELLMSISAVGSYADDNDDEIVAKFGGQRAEDARS